MMKEIEVTYILREVGDTVNISRKVQGASSSNKKEIFSLILTDMISTLKESGASKDLTKEMMNKAIDTIYRMHPIHPEK